jgi:hypothetical protein
MLWKLFHHRVSGGNEMSRIALVSIFFGILFCFINSSIGSIYNEGMIDADLRYEECKVTDDDFVVGTIINKSKTMRPAVKVDMWITNIAETRVFWRKTINLGDMAPGARFEVKEPSNGMVDSASRLQFRFRIPN